MSIAAARNTLARVASRLSTSGRVRVLYGITLELDGVDVLFVNPSAALVFAPVYEGHTMVRRAENVERGLGDAEIADTILRRVARKAA